MQVADSKSKYTEKKRSDYSVRYITDKVVSIVRVVRGQGSYSTNDRGRTKRCSHQSTPGYTQECVQATRDGLTIRFH